MLIVVKTRNAPSSEDAEVTAEEAIHNKDLRRVGLKVTLARVEVLAALRRSAQRHLTAEDIHAGLAADGVPLGVATVYRVLQQLVNAGLVVRRHLDSGAALFELDEGTRHDHLVCCVCGRIVEFADEAIEQRVKRIAAERGFNLREHALVLIGRCCEATLHVSAARE